MESEWSHFRLKRQFPFFPIRNVRWKRNILFFLDVMRLQFKFDFYCVIERNHVRLAEERTLFARIYCRWFSIEIRQLSRLGEANKGEVQTCAGWSAIKFRLLQKSHQRDFDWHRIHQTRLVASRCIAIFLILLWKNPLTMIASYHNKLATADLNA